MLGNSNNTDVVNADSVFDKIDSKYGKALEVVKKYNKVSMSKKHIQVLLINMD